MAAIVICSCSNQATSSVGTSSFDSDSASAEQSNKYVKGKRIFDLEYDIDGYPEETMELDEFPELTFNRKGATLLITGRDTIIDSKGIGAMGIYLADVNGDGDIKMADALGVFGIIKNK